jgi:hypothetical protein
MLCFDYRLKSLRRPPVKGVIKGYWASPFGMPIAYTIEDGAKKIFLGGPPLGPGWALAWVGLGLRASPKGPKGEAHITLYDPLYDPS